MSQPDPAHHRDHHPHTTATAPPPCCPPHPSFHHTQTRIPKPPPPILHVRQCGRGAAECGAVRCARRGGDGGGGGGGARARARVWQWGFLFARHPAALTHGMPSKFAFLGTICLGDGRAGGCGLRPATVDHTTTPHRPAQRRPRHRDGQDPNRRWISTTASVSTHFPPFRAAFSHILAPNCPLPLPGRIKTTTLTN